MGTEFLNTGLQSFVRAGGPQSLQQRRLLQQQQALENQQQQQASQLINNFINPTLPTATSTAQQTGGLIVPNALPSDLGGLGPQVTAQPAINQPPVNQVQQAASFAELQQRRENQKRAQAVRLADTAIKLNSLGEAGQQQAKFLLDNTDLFLQQPAFDAISQVKDVVTQAKTTLILSGEGAALSTLKAAGDLLDPEGKALLNNIIDPTNLQGSIESASATLNQGKFAEIERQSALDIRKERIKGQQDIALEKERRITKSLPQTIVDFKVPTNYQLIDINDPSKGVEPIPNGPADRQTPEQAAKTQLLNDGLSSLANVKKILFEDPNNINESGVDRTNVFNATSSIPFVFKGTPFSEGRTLRAEILNSVEAKLRAESGAAVPDSEVARAAERFMPSNLDNTETIRTKIKNLETFLQGTIDLIDPLGTLGPDSRQQNITQPQTTLPQGVTEEAIQNTLSLYPSLTREEILRQLGQQ